MANNTRQSMSKNDAKSFLLKEDHAESLVAKETKSNLLMEQV